ncbi:hypothetical protein BJ684DRAFT_15464 [Piptocephalis cylindrospora]|uniref:Uncharacterized protein n=1 Tax=Piptocephalis cylindrospora TaxID=1907219 RepID=A0A4P9Y5I0_9FUNG|nr:hypothetical protein BJ684DRAFT_15464 [Piptocephalis cylindrospora]|eukprot:RKP14203.1 hypothetical protein BJ684DRAFT_15464 [Piptocephalis cylindrospora]
MSYTRPMQPPQVITMPEPSIPPPGNGRSGTSQGRWEEGQVPFQPGSRAYPHNSPYSSVKSSSQPSAAPPPLNQADIPYGNYGRSPNQASSSPSNQRNQRNQGPAYTTREMRMQPPTAEDRRRFREQEERRNINVEYDPSMTCPSGGQHTYQATWKLMDTSICQEICICGDSAHSNSFGDNCFSPSGPKKCQKCKQYQ